MKRLLTLLLLIILSVPALARPFQYNVSYGPEYFYFSSNKSNTSANLVTCGIVCSGNIFNRLNLEFRGGVGEISTTKIYFNEVSLLYKTSNDPYFFFGYGLSFQNYDNVLDKSNNVSINTQQTNAKIQWAHVFAPIWGIYLNVVGPNILSYDVGWLLYFDEYFGDFNIRLGYKELRLSEESSMKGPYIASSIYF